MRAGESLELQLVSLAERELSRALREVSDQLGHEDLPAMRRASDPGRLDDALAEEVVLVLHDLAGVHTDSHPHWTLAVRTQVRPWTAGCRRRSAAPAAPKRTPA